MGRKVYPWGLAPKPHFDFCQKYCNLHKIRKLQGAENASGHCQ